MNTKKCAFTGHRPQSLPFGFNEADERCITLKQKLREEIINQIENNGVTHFITGMAIGVDMYAAEIVLGLKASYEGIILESAIPCETQAAKWTEEQRDRYYEIASKCDKETMIQRPYTADCMRWLYFQSQSDDSMTVKLEPQLSIWKAEALFLTLQVTFCDRIDQIRSGDSQECDAP